MLIWTLCGVESDGLVARTVLATVPPSVGYRVIPLGEPLLVSLLA